MLLRRALVPAVARVRFGVASSVGCSPLGGGLSRWVTSTTTPLGATAPPANSNSSSIAGEIMAIDEEDVATQATAEVTAPKFPKGTRVGIVTSARRMRKTIAVQYYKRKYIPKYDVYYKRKLKVFAHDEEEVANEGDKVRVVPGDKRTYRKRHVLESIIKRNAKV